MKVVVDRLNGTLSIRLHDEETVRTVVVAKDVLASLDRFGQLHRLDILKPLDPALRKTILPGIARQFHVPALARLDPRLLINRS